MKHEPFEIDTPSPHAALSADVTILMATYNGAANLHEQLASFSEQECSKWQLVARDDGSTDETCRILKDFTAQGHRVSLYSGRQRLGAAGSFLRLLCVAPRHMPVDGWIAFSDQDDVWFPDRISRGQAALAHCGDTPALYSSRTVIAEDTDNRRISAPRPRRPSFRNALVQNIAAGNTILLNPAAARLVCAAAREVEDVVMHDWWVYQIVMGAGGHMVHDDQPTLLYRQHGQNEIGANDNLKARLKRISMLLRGDFRSWNDTNIAALRLSAERLHPRHRDDLEAFDRLRRSGLVDRLHKMRQLELYRQTFLSTAALWFAAICNRL